MKFFAHVAAAIDCWVRASEPAYAWPAAWLTWGRAPWRLTAALVFRAARWLGLMVSIARPREPAVAVIRTDGIGDAILFEPTLSSLARLHPNFELHLWSPAPVCTLLEAHPAIARFVVTPRGFKAGNHEVFWSFLWRARLGYSLGRFSYALAVYPPGDAEPLGNWLFAKIRAAEKWLPAGSTLNQLDWQRDAAHQSATRILSPSRDHHELLRNAHLAEQWGSAVGHQSPQLPLSKRALTYAGVMTGQARHAVRRAQARGLIGVIAAGSTTLNRYPPELWAEAIRSLWLDHRLLCGLLGGPQDQEALDQIEQLIADVPHHRFGFDHDIAVAAAVVSRMDGLISVDTGLAHAGVAFGVPTVTLITGGMPGRFFSWPEGHKNIALTKKVPCAGCNYRCTQPTPICVTEIDPAQIVQAMARLLKTPAQRTRSAA